MTQTQRREPQIVTQMEAAVLGFRAQYPRWFTKKLVAAWNGEVWGVIAFPKDGSKPVVIGTIADSYALKDAVQMSADPSLYHDVVRIPE